MKTTFAYDHYYLHDEIKHNLEYFSAKYPDLCQVQVLCVTELGLNQYAVTLTNTKTGDALSKPGYYMDGNIHAGEVTASMTCMYLVDYLLTNYRENEEVTQLLDTETIYVLPRISPDGAENYLTTPNFMYSAPRDWKEVYGGVAPEDIDGDGVVRMMRYKDPYGIWKLDPEDPEQMVERKPDETAGEFYSVWTEGSFEAYDGDENLKEKKMKWSMNFNRNFPYGWFPDPREIGAGDFPLSFPEIRAVHDFIVSHPNIGGISAMHTTAGMILFPPGTRPEAQGLPADMKAFRAIGKMGTEETGYPCVNIFDTFLADQVNYSSGALDDWAYENLGIAAYTVELWDLANRVGMPEDMTARISGDLDTKKRRYNAYRNWVKENAPDAYVPWHEYDHPHFSKVEIGGYNYKFTQQNPPGHMLCELCEGIARYMIRFARCMPRVEVVSLQKEEVTAGVYKITAVVGNRGFLPTNITDQAVRAAVNKPVVVEVSGVKAFVTGKEKEEIGDLSGFSRAQTKVSYGLVTNRKEAAMKRKVSWVVRADAGDTVTVRVSHEKSGNDTKKIIL